MCDKVDWCNTKNHCKGLCNKHYLQNRNHGIITDDRVKSIKGELWKTLNEHSNYKISSLGRFINIKYNKLISVFRPKSKPSYIVSINHKSYLVHTLVANNFIKNKYFDTTIIFKDGNRENYYLSNLQWFTDSIDNTYIENKILEDSSVLSKEKWKQIKSIKDHYISSLGRIKTYKNSKEYIYKNSINVSQSGTKRVTVNLDFRKDGGKYRSINVHSYVGKYFIEDINDSILIFKDGNYGNCCSDNLMWMSSFNSIASKNTISKYKLLSSDIGHSCYQYVIGKKEFIYNELSKFRYKFVRILQKSYCLSEYDADDAFTSGMIKFIKKVPTGFITNDKTITGLFINQCRYDAIIIASKNSKSQSISLCGDNGEFSFIDYECYSDIEGKSHYYEDSYASINRF